MEKDHHVKLDNPDVCIHVFSHMRKLENNLLKGDLNSRRTAREEQVRWGEGTV
jgi:hypothetical protein